MKKVNEESLSLRQHARELANTTLSGDYDLLLACRELADFGARLTGVPEDALNTFRGVASEVDGLPIGPEREHWARDALKSKDAEAAEYRERVKEVVHKALKQLLDSLGEQPH